MPKLGWKYFRRGGSKVITIKIREDLCIGCRYCAIICPCNVLDLRSEVLAYVADLDKCNGCKKCEECPEQAISVNA